MTSKGTDAEEQTQTKQECCMCGDCGFTDQLFQCKVCLFRSQHRYCSNLYPKVKSYETCNLCLSQKYIKEKSLNSSNSSSSSSYKNNGSDNDESKNMKIAQNVGCNEGFRKSAIQFHLDRPIKKPKLPEAISPSTSPSQLVSTHKMNVTNEALEERVRRSKSEHIKNRTGLTKPVFRNKVRRCKLLDELSR